MAPWHASLRLHGVVARISVHAGAMNEGHSRGAPSTAAAAAAAPAAACNKHVLAAHLRLLTPCSREGGRRVEGSTNDWGSLALASPSSCHDSRHASWAGGSVPTSQQRSIVVNFICLWCGVDATVFGGALPTMQSHVLPCSSWRAPCSGTTVQLATTALHCEWQSSA